MVEAEALNKKEIETERNVEMVGKHRRGNGNRLERWYARGRFAAFGLALDGGNVGSVNDVGTTSVGWCNGTVTNGAPSQNVLELRRAWTADLAIKVASSIGILDLSRSEQLLLCGYRGQYGVTGNRLVSNIRVVNI